MFTVTFALHRKTDLDREEALRYWREQHGPVAAALADVSDFADAEQLQTAFTEEVLVVG
jgi:hypothetical protein